MKILPQFLFCRVVECLGTPAGHRQRLYPSAMRAPPLILREDLVQNRDSQPRTVARRKAVIFFELCRNRMFRGITWHYLCHTKELIDILEIYRYTYPYIPIQDVYLTEWNEKLSGQRIKRSSRYLGNGHISLSTINSNSSMWLRILSIHGTTVS